MARIGSCYLMWACEYFFAEPQLRQILLVEAEVLLREASHDLVDFPLQPSSVSSRRSGPRGGGTKGGWSSGAGAR